MVAVMNHSAETIAVEKENQLVDYLRSLGRVVVAFSGGVDSTYLMKIARITLGENAVAVFARGAMISTQEQQEAIYTAKTMDVPLQIIDYDVMKVEGFVHNQPDRCYHCKMAIFSRIKSIAGAQGFGAVLDGTNQSDQGDYRPGQIALRELGVYSPLQKIGLSKEEIRLLSRRRGLPTWEKPSMACLASRVPFGDHITLDILKKVETAEAVLEVRGFTERRVRVHGDTARIEIPPAAFARLITEREAVLTGLKALGFRYVTLDIEGLRSGSLNPVKEAGAD